MDCTALPERSNEPYKRVRVLDPDPKAESGTTRSSQELTERAYKCSTPNPGDKVVFFVVENKTEHVVLFLNTVKQQSVPHLENMQRGIRSRVQHNPERKQGQLPDRTLLNLNRAEDQKITVTLW